MENSLMNLDPSEVEVLEDRQRAKGFPIDDLLESFKRYGQIQPIVINRANQLIAGERRLETCKKLNLKVKAIYLDNLEADELQVEYIENAHRKNLEWKEDVIAIAKIHHALQSKDAMHSLDATAKVLGMSKSAIAQRIAIYQFMGNYEVQKCRKFSQALQTVGRISGRQEKVSLTEAVSKSKETLSLGAQIKEVPKLKPEVEGLSTLAMVKTPDKVSKKETYPFPVIKVDFFEWILEEQETKASVVHFDPPYGVKFGQSDLRARGTGEYEDSEETFYKFLDAFLENQDSFIAPNAHLLFWHSMNHYPATRHELEEAGWEVVPQPLIWGKTLKTTIPDVLRRPKGSYEACLFCYRGDITISKLKSNLYMSSGASHKDHMSEKDPAMLEHFFEMVVDETSHFLDLCSGSGSALFTARKFKPKTIRGLEFDEEYVSRIRAKWVE